MKDVGNLRHRSLIRCPGARITRARKESAATRRWTNAVVRAIEAVCLVEEVRAMIAIPEARKQRLRVNAQEDRLMKCEHHDG